MSKTYLITLTPTGKFFFGGDMTFTVNGEESEFTSYIIRSNKFPQQTSLLGMLRFLILRNNSEIFDAVAQTIKNDKRSIASNLIGPRSFEKSGNEGDFGKIKKLYPCFLQKDGQDVDLLPKDEMHKVTFGETIGCLNGKRVSVPKEIKDFDPKDGIDTLYRIGEKDFEEKDIFEEDVCNGINRDIKTGKTEDNALFKQVSYRLKDGFRFAFYAEVDLNDLSNYSGQLVSVGGDNSQFVIGIEEKTMPECKKAENGTKVVLTSPAYIPDLECVKFAIADTIPFKCMKTETASVASYNKRNQMYGYSEKLMLYTSGSVFYVDSENLKSFCEKLDNQKDFRQIGYNHYQVK